MTTRITSHTRLGAATGSAQTVGLTEPAMQEDVTSPHTTGRAQLP